MGFPEAVGKNTVADNGIGDRLCRRVPSSQGNRRAASQKRELIGRGEMGNDQPGGVLHGGNGRGEGGADGAFGTRHQ